MHILLLISISMNIKKWHSSQYSLELPNRIILQAVMRYSVCLNIFHTSLCQISLKQTDCAVHLRINILRTVQHIMI